MYRSPLVSPDFAVPSTLEAEAFRLRPLDYEVMLQDYEALVTGAEHIARAYERDESYYQGFTLQDEVIELGWHIGEWRRRHSFAYAVMSHDGKRCFGSFYLYPTLKRDYDAMGVMWTVEGPDFDRGAFGTVSQWVANVWPFREVGYPGRSQSWKDWHALPE